MTNETTTTAEIMTETVILSDADLDLVTGGLNPQPLPPASPPSEPRQRSRF